MDEEKKAAETTAAENSEKVSSFKCSSAKSEWHTFCIALLTSAIVVAAYHMVVLAVEYLCPDTETEYSLCICHQNKSEDSEEDCENAEVKKPRRKMSPEMRERLKNMTPEERAEFKKKMAARREKFKNMTPEERAEFKKKMAARRKQLKAERKRSAGKPANQVPPAEK